MPENSSKWAKNTIDYIFQGGEDGGDCGGPGGQDETTTDADTVIQAPGYNNAQSSGNKNVRP